RPIPDLRHDIGHRRRAGRAERVSALAAIRCAPLCRQYLRPPDVHDLRARGARQHDRRLRRRLRHERDHFGWRLLCIDGVGLRPRVHLLHRADVHAAARDSGTMTFLRTTRRNVGRNVGTVTLALIGLAILVAAPFVTPGYFLHLVIQVLLWGFVYTAWSLM